MNDLLRVLAVILGLILMLPGLCTVLAGAAVLQANGLTALFSLGSFAVMIIMVTGGLAVIGWFLVRGRR